MWSDAHTNLGVELHADVKYQQQYFQTRHSTLAGRLFADGSASLRKGLLCGGTFGPWQALLRPLKSERGSK
jgi:hypothetical protein